MSDVNGKTRPAPKRTTPDDLHRLAAQGHADGCEVLPGRYADAGRVTSSDPEAEPYIVFLAPGPFHGCDCPGYERHARCKHYALLLEACGWLPDLGDTYELTELGRETLATMRADERRAVAAADLGKRSDAAVR